MRKVFFVLSFTPVFLLALVVQVALACCIDCDQDGYGVAFLSECPHPDQLDCDDDTSDDPVVCSTCACGEPDCAPCAKCIHPGMTEAAYGDPICGDGVDNDCDGRIDMMDEGCFECTVDDDCDDGNPCTDDLCVDNACVTQDNTAPCDDGDACTMDDVCSGGTCSAGPPLDADDDGFISDSCGGEDCNDSDPAVHPGVFEAPPEDPVCTDGVDNNCNGYTDLEDAGCVPVPQWTAGETADAAVYGTPSGKGSRLSNLLFALLVPVGAAVFLRRLFRKS